MKRVKKMRSFSPAALSSLSISSGDPILPPLLETPCILKAPLHPAQFQKAILTNRLLLCCNYRKGATSGFAFAFGASRYVMSLNLKRHLELAVAENSQAIGLLAQNLVSQKTLRGNLGIGRQ